MHKIRVLYLVIFISFLFILGIILTSYTRFSSNNSVIIFYAAGFSPVIDDISEDISKNKGIIIRGEASGSQVACRKVTDLKRRCDLLISADKLLFTTIFRGYCSWRIDFACDEVVIGVGKRARYIDKAEQDWAKVLSEENVVIGRVSENLGPIGYRTLTVWKLKEKYGYPGLYNRLLRKASKVVDHVSKLAMLLKAGDIDYGFVYKSTCIAHDIRFIPLDRRINLSDPSCNYSSVCVKFFKESQKGREEIKIFGEPIMFSLTIPNNADNKDLAIQIVRYILKEKKNILEQKGFIPIIPRFWGDKEEYKDFEDIAEYKGEL